MSSTSASPTSGPTCSRSRRSAGTTTSSAGSCAPPTARGTATRCASPTAAACAARSAWCRGGRRVSAPADRRRVIGALVEEERRKRLDARRAGARRGGPGRGRRGRGGARRAHRPALRLARLGPPAGGGRRPAADLLPAGPRLPRRHVRLRPRGHRRAAGVVEPRDGRAPGAAAPRPARPRRPPGRPEDAEAAREAVTRDPGPPAHRSDTRGRERLTSDGRAAAERPVRRRLALGRLTAVTEAAESAALPPRRHVRLVIALVVASLLGHVRRLHGVRGLVDADRGRGRGRVGRARREDREADRQGRVARRATPPARTACASCSRDYKGGGDHPGRVPRRAARRLQRGPRGRPRRHGRGRRVRRQARHARHEVPVEVPERPSSEGAGQA